jgi:putative DNA-invertase from lambdoid prophage Rac
MLDMDGDVTNGKGKLVFTILSAVAEAERDRIRERVAETKADQRKRGRFLGGKRQFGYAIQREERGARMVENPEEQAAFADMRKLSAKGLSLRKIAEKMRARGFVLTYQTVKGVLDRAKA